MKREQLIDYVYLRLDDEQKQMVREELAEDFTKTFNVLQLMEKRAAGELDMRNFAIMEDEINATNTKGRPAHRKISVTTPKLYRTGGGGKIDDSSLNNGVPVLPIDILRAYLLDGK